MAGLLETLDTIANLSYAATLLLIIYGGFRGWWVYGPAYRAKAEECEEERGARLEYQQKYEDLLKADIEERKHRDRTLELLSNSVIRRADQ